MSIANADNLGHPQLRQLIQTKILQHPDRRMTFAEFMDLALYHPNYGYYNNRARKIGPTGDFFTAPHLGADFGELLAVQFVDMWEQLGQPQPFTIVEMGAGQGLLAQDVLRYLQAHHGDLFDGLTYVIIEKATGLIAQQQAQLQPQFGDRIQLDWRSLDAMAAQPIVGCYFSNELVDAFAVHLVEFVQGQLQEVYVTVMDDRLTEVLGSISTPKLANYFELIGMRPVGGAYPDRYRTEVNLAGLDWISQVAVGLQRGYVLTIDYGYPAARYYNRVRSSGTLQCYYQHSHHADPYIYVGEQDITAHVDFTSLERQGAAVGLTKLGVTQQAMFLMALGLGDRLAELGRSESRDPQEVMRCLRQRDALHQLINPMGMGNFGVLLQGKGLSATQQDVKGLQAPIPNVF